MNFKLLLTTAAIVIATIPTPARAQSQPSSTDTAQSQQTSRQVLEACTQNRAETLPNPFTDVPANHWAFKAVLTMHYCGAFRQATPASLIDRLTNQTEVPPQPQPAQ